MRHSAASELRSITVALNRVVTLTRPGQLRCLLPQELQPLTQESATFLAVGVGRQCTMNSQAARNVHAQTGLSQKSHNIDKIGALKIRS